MSSVVRSEVLGLQIDKLSTDEAVESIICWAEKSVPGYVCVSNVHQCMEAFDDKCFRDLVNSASLVIPDSQILVWAQKILGARDVKPVVRGVDLTILLCEKAAERDLRVGLYGGSKESLQRMGAELKFKFPSLNICFQASPPYRILSEDEESRYRREIMGASVQMLLVGLGCPKQERWMADQVDHVSCTMIGVGAAFDFISGVNKPSPRWIHRIGLEWFYRLCLEPKRLWKRYLKHNSRFLFYLTLQRVGKLSRAGKRECA